MAVTNDPSLQEAATNFLSKSTSSGPRTFIFLHPDLGIGGAERLVVDAAVGLQNAGHKVILFTSHCSPSHCFDECRNGTLDVRIRSDWLPQAIFGRFFILCAILRQLMLIFQCYFTGEFDEIKGDTFIVDQLSAGLPVLQYLWPNMGIIFYCHFPDKLLALGRSNPLKKLWRIPFDWLEEVSTSYAHTIAVNSSFTKSMVEKHLPLLATRDLRVVYPALELPTEKKLNLTWPDEKLLLSINRFERKKAIDLSIKAFAALPPTTKLQTRLVIAGGYDTRVPENVEYHKELCILAESFDLGYTTAFTVDEALAVPPISKSPILFLPSVSSELKAALLNRARLLLYTPSHEHFGIVPLEAMNTGTPVLACNNGGPMETVVDGSTGWLRNPLDIPAWTEVLAAILDDSPQTVQRLALMAAAGKKRVESFGVPELAERLERLARDVEDTPKRRTLFTSFLNMVGIVLTFLLGLLVAKVLFP